VADPTTASGQSSYFDLTGRSRPAAVLHLKPKTYKLRHCCPAGATFSSAVSEKVQYLNFVKISLWATESVDGSGGRDFYA